jgi:hypothetical protein
MIFSKTIINSYNPFIYCWLNKKFRNGAKKYLLCLCCCHQNESSNENISNRGYITDTIQIDTNRNNIELQGVRENLGESNINISPV